MSDDDTDDPRPEYPAELIRSGVRGKYARRFRAGSNVVLIDPYLTEAFQWHEKQRPGLGAEFMAAVDAKLEHVQAGPNQFPRARGLVRRAIVHRFPYGIFFVAHSELVNVVAVMHHARDPRHWRGRVQGNR